MGQLDPALDLQFIIKNRVYAALTAKCKRLPVSCLPLTSLASRPVRHLPPAVSTASPFSSGLSHLRPLPAHGLAAEPPSSLVSAPVLDLFAAM